MSSPSVDFLIPCTEATIEICETISNSAFCADGLSVRFLILVDGGGELTGLFAERFSRHEVVVLGSGAGKLGPATVRNQLAKASKADWIVFVDSDVIVPVSFFQGIRKALEIAQEGVVLAPEVRNGGPNNLVARFFSHYVLAPGIIAGRLVVPSTTLLMRRTTFESSRGFEQSFRIPGGEDWEWVLRNNARNPCWAIWYSPAWRVYHRNPGSLRDLLVRGYLYGTQHHRYQHLLPKRPNRLNSANFKRVSLTHWQAGGVVPQENEEWSKDFRPYAGKLSRRVTRIESTLYWLLHALFWLAFLAGRLHSGKSKGSG